MFQERVDTTKGYCEDTRYGRVTFGAAGYDDITCQKFLCGREWIIGFSCDTKVKEKLAPGCYYVNGTGHYPACCPQLQCEPIPS
ncbi:hypothetical protein AVEN_267297-1 [Araneus ventricosus]|uniref:Single domain-containing protein n=1 Tax=Araneus ventricosus TaxID=182803 RepID=A0A4Y2DL27_ARAVE|nr:hypothetical protein AVEN_267297-1 [Araneus ventricosus]